MTASQLTAPDTGAEQRYNLQPDAHQSSHTSVCPLVCFKKLQKHLVKQVMLGLGLLFPITWYTLPYRGSICYTVN